MLDVNQVLYRMNELMSSETFLSRCKLYTDLEKKIESNIAPIDKCMEIATAHTGKTSAEYFSLFDERIINVKLDIDLVNLDKYIMNSNKIYYFKYKRTDNWNTFVNTFIALAKYCEYAGIEAILNSITDMCNHMNINSEKLVILNEDNFGVCMTNPVVHSSIDIIRGVLIETGHNISGIKFY